MKDYLNFLLLVCVASLASFGVTALQGCESLRGHSDLLVDISVSQGVIRYVEAGATATESVQRREQLISALSVARKFVVSDEPFNASTWLGEFQSLMHWDALSVADRILLGHVLDLVRQEIDKRAGDSAVRVYLNRVINVAIDTAAQL